MLIMVFLEHVLEDVLGVGPLPLADNVPLTVGRPGRHGLVYTNLKNWSLGSESSRVYWSDT